VGLKDYHIHSTYSDGKSTPREIVEKAIEIGVEEIGFSDHSYTAFDLSYCMKKEQLNEYKIEILKLKEEFKDKISVLLGIEQDYFSEESTKDYEYVIGSVHYVLVDGDYIPIDNSANTLINAANKYFDGDIYALCEVYFDTVSKLFEKVDADIIGHIDLITKFNEKTPLIDENNERYVNSWKKAVDRLISYNKPFEINFGAITRGHRTTPYPSKQLLEYIKEKGGKLILSSDSHFKDTICYKFEEMSYLLY